MKQSDYSAELFVAGRFADAGWNVYFPHRDKGFDFIVIKNITNHVQVMRPVQVKGKYPSSSKTDKAVYGFVGELSETHPEMVLAIPFYSQQQPTTPSFVAYMPFSQIRPHSRGVRCQPARFRRGRPEPCPGYKFFVDQAGLLLLEEPTWKDTVLSEMSWT